MANNRVYLYCPSCEEAQHLANCLGEGYHGPAGTQEGLGGDFQGFLNDHLRCEESHGEARQIELRFEHHQDRAREMP